MSPSGGPRIRRYLLVFLVLFGGASPAAAQWEMGSYSTLSRPKGPPLMHSGSVRSYGFVSGVGGVAFSEVAQVGPGLAGRAFTLRYDPNEPDGRRLIVKVSGAMVQVDLAERRGRPQSP